MTNVAMEYHHVYWENPLFLWPFSKAMLNYQRVMLINGLFMVYSWIIHGLLYCLLTMFFSSIDGVLMFYLVYKPPNSDNL